MDNQAEQTQGATGKAKVSRRRQILVEMGWLIVRKYEENERKQQLEAEAKGKTLLSPKGGAV